ncbi:Leucine--tRNA ligase [Candidatus Clavichlamydia salmonicola]|uniref:leucine--tRNA ligase n=1 Tax=Candidatus Clavichlamydia salmonicola TaxID=469812 RepID=UPI0018917539|nr:leucine--tRNA ligase [Candidatus Clavichlamydia salmonicola]MBF5051218.1 Leucine--tRNA ligase [Candidatus Clavichlamydia salmonicola]
MIYDPVLIEKKWQKFWEDNAIFLTKEDAKKPKYYVLDMFPYPSGSGLHVGHLIGYTATDIIARYKRSIGFNVLHPMGWDSFGLPAEQYALKTGIHPSITTKKNIDTFRFQLKAMGYSYDWSREITTSDSDYYKWTQWIFIQLYNKGLAFESNIPVNFCPHLKTVLSNEEIDNGVSKEGGYPIEKRMLKQWMLRITHYADRLEEDLKELDWPESLKKLQKYWIGRSEGTSLIFHNLLKTFSLEIFSSRIETLGGISFIAISPEHPLIESLITENCRIAVTNYLTKAKLCSERDRLKKIVEKKGVFTGAYVINPLDTTKKIPIWIADYVLPGYGTGAVMGVPAHDQRDFEFAIAHDIPFIPVIIPYDHSLQEEVRQGFSCWEGDGICQNSSFNGIDINGMSTKEGRDKLTAFIEEQHLGKYQVCYKIRDWLFSRQRYWGEPIPFIHFKDGSGRILNADELPLLPPTLEDYHPDDSGKSPLAKSKEWVHIQQDPITGKEGFRETNTMPQWAGSSWYYLRFCDPNNKDKAWDKQAEQYWGSVDLYVGGAEHAVLHLLYARFWHKVLYDLNLVSTKEPFHKLINQGLIMSPAYKDNSGLYIDPKNVENGPDGLFYKKGTLDLLEKRTEKMSKSKLNGINPLELLEEYGADAMRMYAMFAGPLEKEKTWNNDGVNGCRRFLNRFFALVSSKNLTDVDNEESLSLAHKLVFFVTKDLEDMSFNTAIARFMEFLNDFSSLSIQSKKALKMVTKVLSPFAPHAAEEAWILLGEKPGIDQANWPIADEKYLITDVIIYAIQVNGKLRDNISIKNNTPQACIIKQALEQPKISKYMTSSPKKTIFIPGKLINFVI